MRAWIWLALAILLEITGTVCLKLSDGLVKLPFNILTFVFYGLSFTVLSFALKKLELGIAYAIWAGLGTALIAILGIFIFNESMSVSKLFFITLIVTGVIGLNFSGAH